MLCTTTNGTLSLGFFPRAKMQRQVKSYIIRFPPDSTPAQCWKCEELRPITQFYKHSARLDGAIRYRPMCRLCSAVQIKKCRNRPLCEQRISDGKYACNKCQIVKPLSEMCTNGRYPDGIIRYRAVCKTCHCNNSKHSYHNNKQTKINNVKDPHTFLADLVLKSSYRRKNFNIDVTYICDLLEKQKHRCAISGLPLTFKRGAGHVKTNASIDRIDNEKGYDKGNVQLVCRWVNQTRGNMSIKEFIEWCEGISEYQKNQIQDPGLGSG